MKNLKTLVLMQLKDKVDFSYLKSFKKTLFKVVFTILKFAIITGLIYVGFMVLSYFRLVSSFMGIPQDFLTVVFTIMYALSIIACTFGLTKALYEGKDNQLLLTFPANRDMVFTSKLIVYYIYELIRNTTYILPLFVAYGMINSLPFYFYFWLIAIYFVIVAVPVVIGALLSIPAMYIINFVKQHKWLEYVLLVAGISLVVYGLIAIIRAIPEDLDIIGSWGTTYWEIRAFLENFIKIFSPFYYVVVAITGIRNGVATKMFLGSQLISSLVLLGIVVGVFGLAILVVRPLYFHMASSPFEYRKIKVSKQYKNQKNDSFWSAIKKDLILTYRTQEKFYGLVGVTLGMPIAILLLNKLYSAMDTRLSGTIMTIAFNVLMILLIALSSSISMAHIYSEEGASNYLLKSSPKPYLQTLIVKLMPNFIAITVSIIASVSIMCNFFGYGVGRWLQIFGIIEFVYVAHLLLSAELDIMNPQANQYQTNGSHHNNPNDIKSTLYAFVFSAGVAFILYFLLGESQIVAWWKVLGLVTAFLVLRVWMYINKIKAYFKEKQ